MSGRAAGAAPCRGRYYRARCLCRRYAPYRAFSCLVHFRSRALTSRSSYTCIRIHALPVPTAPCPHMPHHPGLSHPLRRPRPLPLRVPSGSSAARAPSALLSRCAPAPSTPARAVARSGWSGTLVSCHLELSHPCCRPRPPFLRVPPGSSTARVPLAVLPHHVPAPAAPVCVAARCAWSDTAQKCRSLSAALLSSPCRARARTVHPLLGHACALWARVRACAHHSRSSRSRPCLGWKPWAWVRHRSCATQCTRSVMVQFFRGHVGWS